MADYPSVYGSPQVGSSVASTPGLLDMLGGMGMGGWPGAGGNGGAQSPQDTPEQQQQKKRQQQQMAMAQAGLKMMGPHQLQSQPVAIAPMMQNAPVAPMQMPAPVPSSGYMQPAQQPRPAPGMPSPFGGRY